MKHMKRVVDMLKKIFSSLMAVVLVLGLLPTVALADESSNANDDTENATAAESYVSNIDTDTSNETSEDTSLSVTPLATEDIASGTLGTCTWTIDSEGCLTIAPTDGISGEFSMYIIGSSVWPWYNYRTDIEAAKIVGNVSASGSLAYMLYGATFLESIDFSSLDTSNVTNMSWMFEGCTFLESADLSGWNTSNVTDMSNMFYSCTFLNTADLSNWDTAQVTNMNYMFINCNSLSSINLFGWDTSSVKGINAIFYNCAALTTLDLSGWNTSNMTNMESAFRGCSSLTTLNLSGWDTSNVTDIGYMFNNCSSLLSVEISNFNTSRITNMQSMFAGCSSLVNLDLSGWDTSRVTNMSSLFENCTSLSSLDLSTWDTSRLMSTSSMFSRCSSLVYLNLSSLNTSHITSASSMFYGCTGLRTVVLGEKFAFIDGNYLPTPVEDDKNGRWVSDNGTIYDSPSDIPSNVSATYTALFPTDATTLEATIEKAEALNSANYTNDSWSALESVLVEAKDVLADIFSTQEEIDAAAHALQNAIDALEMFFTDVANPSEWYYDSVYYIADLGLITGYGNGLFGVGDSLTRAQLVTILWRYCEPDAYANYDEKNARNQTDLPDVADGQYYTEAANWAVSRGIITGVAHTSYYSMYLNTSTDFVYFDDLGDDGGSDPTPRTTYTFNPDDPVTFDQMVTILARYVLGFSAAENYNASILSNSRFTDGATVEDWARGSMAWAIDNNVVTGNENANGTYTIAPLDNVARERGATVLARSIQSGLITAS